MKPIRILPATLFALSLAACSSAATPVAEAPAAVSTPAVKATESSPAPSAPAHDEQTFEGARAAVGRLEAVYVRKDAGAAWDMLTASGKAAMSRKDFVYVVTHCTRLLSESHNQSMSLNDTNTVLTITATHDATSGGETYEWQMIYEAGFWKHQPSDGALKWMVLGPKKGLALLRDQDLC